MGREPRDDDTANEEGGMHAVPPTEDLFNFDEDRVDFMRADSFPASDPPPPQSSGGPDQSSKTW